LSTLGVHTLECHQVLDFDFKKLEHQLAVYLGPNPSREDLHALTFSFTNVITQLTGGEPISLDVLAQEALAAYPFSLRNAAETIASFVAQCLRPLPADSEFVGMADYIVDSIHDLLELGSETFSNSNSSRRSHYHRTIQIIRAQVQKQSSERSNFRT
jgi:hypothetical protein